MFGNLSEKRKAARVGVRDALSRGHRRPELPASGERPGAARLRRGRGALRLPGAPTHAAPLRRRQRPPSKDTNE